MVFIINSDFSLIYMSTYRQILSQMLLRKMFKRWNDNNRTCFANELLLSSLRMNCGERSLTYLSTIKRWTTKHFSRERILVSTKQYQLGYHLPGASITRGKYLTSNSSITAILVLMSDAHRRRPRPRSASNVVPVLLCKIKSFRRPTQFSWKYDTNDRFLCCWNLIWQRKPTRFIELFDRF